MTKRPTILDVARHAGVSKSTVSLVLQNSPSVKDSTRIAVEEAMAKIGYVYNRSAAGLRGASSGLIGLVINDLRNPFFTEFAASVQMTFAEKGFATVVANTDEDPTLQANVIASMIEHGVNAFVVSPTYANDKAVFDRLERSSIPTMQVLRQVDERTDVFPFFSLDYQTGSRLAARHLAEMGCENIAFVGGLEDRPVTLERVSGYDELMETEQRRKTYFYGRPSRAFGRNIARRIAKDQNRPDGLICFSDLVALGMISGFAETGIQPGKDVRIIGFDDIEESSLCYPRLSTIRCDVSSFGKSAADALLGWLESGLKPEAVKRYPVELIVRQSTLQF